MKREMLILKESLAVDVDNNKEAYYYERWFHRNQSKILRAKNLHYLGWLGAPPAYYAGRGRMFSATTGIIAEETITWQCHYARASRRVHRMGKETWKNKYGIEPMYVIINLLSLYIQERYNEGKAYNDDNQDIEMEWKEFAKQCMKRALRFRRT